jgi:hypothetical protein
MGWIPNCPATVNNNISRISQKTLLLKAAPFFRNATKNQQIRRESHAQPTQVGKHLTRNPPCQRPVIQDAKQGGGSEIADGPQGHRPTAL